jgi:hypothetical protein
MLRKFGIIAVLSLIVVALTASVALASQHRANPTGNAKFQQGPFFTLNDDNSVTATGLLTGLGSDTVNVTLSVSATADVSCTNRGQQTVAAQQKLADTSTTQLAQQPENGRLALNITTAAPDTLIGNPCPNRNWTPAIIPGTVTVTSATLSLVQNGTFVAGTPITYTF